MVHLANKSQPVRVGVMYPRGVYSRVVSCVAFLTAPKTEAFAYTASLGNRLWLLDVKVWFDPSVWTAIEGVTFKILHGTSVPGTFAEIMEWKNVLPLLFRGNVDARFGWWANFEPLEFEMNELYDGKGLRFGIAMSVTPTVSSLWGYASFQISEG